MIAPSDIIRERAIAFRRHPGAFLRMRRLLLIAVLALSGIAACAEEPAMDPLAVTAVEALAREDASAVAARIAAMPDARHAARVFSDALRVAYRAKEVARMSLIARAGIDWCLMRADALAATDAELAGALRGEAKTMAYNLGVNLWPGWKEPGIALSRSDLGIGLDAARLNLRLAIELKRDAMPLSNAHWLLGAQRLASGDHAGAEASFGDAEVAARQARNGDAEVMCWAYKALARVAAGAQYQELESAVAALRERGTADGRAFAEQVETAATVLLPSR